MQKKNKFAVVVALSLTAALIPMGSQAQADDQIGGDAYVQRDDVTRVEVPIQTTSPEVAEAIVGDAKATAVRFEYVNAVGEYTISSKNNWAEEMSVDLEKEYGALPPVTAVVFESTEPPSDEQVEQVRGRAQQEQSTAQRAATTTDVMADVSPVDPTRETQSALRTQRVNLSGLDDLPDWYPSWHLTRAQTLSDGTREIVVGLEWAEGQSPGGGNWGGTRGLEIETNLRNPAGAGITRRPNPFNNCPDGDMAFWTARNPDKSVDFWALESPSGQDLRASKPYFDTVNSTDSCEFMSQTVGIGLPNRLPAQDWNPEYWLIQTRIQGVSGSVEESPMMGNIDPVSNDCPTGAIASECMGLSDELKPLDVPSEAMFSFDRGITAPGCAAREYGGEPFECF